MPLKEAPLAEQQRAIDMQYTRGQHVDAEVVASLNQNPLGTLQGEANLTTPFNATTRRPNVYIVNHSRTITRRVCVVPVSTLSGAEEALRYSKDYQKVYGNAENLYAAAKRRDMSIYEDKVLPCVAKVRLGGQDFFIPPATEEDPNNPPVERMRDDGVWDIYMGNWERMHSMEMRVAADEQARLSLSWKQKHNPIKFVVEDGVRTETDNPFGYLEIIRETPKEAPTRVDGRFVTAQMLVEG